MDVSSEHFLTELLGYQKTAALKAAIELDLFSTLSDLHGDIEAVAERTGASERGLRKGAPSAEHSDQTFKPDSQPRT